MDYRVVHSRSDVPPETWKTFKAPDDEAALKEYKECLKNEALSWDYVSLVRIDQVEKTTLLASKDP